MNSIKTIFFGSTDDSVIVLNKIWKLETSDWRLEVTTVVTQPAKAVGREQIVTPTPVEVWATTHKIPVLTFLTDKETPWLYQNESDVIESLSTFRPELIVSACYGQRIPFQTIQHAKYGGINVHPSLLPRWRGGDPVPWAILSGDHQTGVSVVTLAESFDQGRVLGQKKLPIVDSDFPDDLRTRLFSLGADLLVDLLPKVLTLNLASQGLPLQTLQTQKYPYARRLTREDGFIPFELIESAIEARLSSPRRFSPAKPDLASRDNITIIRTALELSEEKQIHPPLLIERAFRAFSPWPGIWTTVDVHGQKKRLKLLDIAIDQSKKTLIIKKVQLEGKTPVSWEQFTKAYLNTE